MGNPDPTDIINAENNRIPLRAENFSLNLWKDTFRSWPKTTKEWKDWFLRVSGANEVYWVECKLDQCIRLSIADMEKNESMMIATSYFWSDTLNTFMFGHGPASPSLADVLMLIGLDISTANDGSLFNRKPDYKVEHPQHRRLDRIYPKVSANRISRCWRSLSTKYSHQINKEKDQNATNTQT